MKQTNKHNSHELPNVVLDKAVMIGRVLILILFWVD